MSVEDWVLKIRGRFAVLGSDTKRVSTVLGVFDDYEKAVSFKVKKAKDGWRNVLVYEVVEERPRSAK
jgi:hypothetical protein